MNLKSLLVIIPTIIFDVIAVVIFFKVIEPFAKWYLSKSPAVGVDLYNSVTYVSYHLRHFSLPFNSFKDIWFGGYPLILDFPQTAFYLMIPFARQFGTVVGVQIFALVALFIFIYCCFQLYFKLSKNFGISVFLAGLVFLSPNIYPSLTWAGSIPYFASMAFLPLGLLLAVNYFEEPDFGNLLVLTLVAAIGFLIHPLSILVFLIPSIIIFILISSISLSHKLTFALKHLLVFALVFLGCTFVVTYKYVFDLGSFIEVITPSSAVSASNSQVAVESAAASAAYLKAQIPRLLTNTDPMLLKMLYVGAGLALVGLVLSPSKKKIGLTLCFLFVTLLTVVHPILNLSGIFSLFWHDPYRAFWQFTTLVGALSAIFWGHFFSALAEKLNPKNYLPFLHIGVNAIMALLFLSIFYILFQNKVTNLLSTIEHTSYLIELSSTYPEALSIDVRQNSQDRLKKQVLPSFLNESEKNFRLYSADATVNIWWNSFFDIPLARGYVDPPLSTSQRGGLFWLDIAIANDSLVRDFKYGQETAYNNALFLIDWNGIGYFEGGRQGVKGPSAPPSSYLLNSEVFEKEEEVTTYGSVSKWSTASGVPELKLNAAQNLKFYKLREQYTSPILTATNAPAAIFFGTRANYEDYLRLLASVNINSRKLVLVYGSAYADSLNLAQLADFEAVFLDSYKFHNRNRGFGVLEKYVEGGGKLYLETGGETKEADSEDLPKVFPIKNSQRGGMGRDWDLAIVDKEVTSSVDLSQFGPPIFDDDQWKVTSTDINSLRDGAQVILENKGRPVLVRETRGKGQVYWSGVNLAFHYSHYKSRDEAKLFGNMLSAMINLTENQLVESNPVWQSPQKVRIEAGNKARGILFKEQGYDGWKAMVSVAGKNFDNQKLYLAGPTYPGFIYLPLGNIGEEGPTVVMFNFNGRSLYWFAAFINLVAVLAVFEVVLFSGYFVGRHVHYHLGKLGKKVFHWWEREEE